MKKNFSPESFDFGMPAVELIGVGSKGLDKTAMVKRASVFDDMLGNIEKKANREYLHVITTGAFEKYGANANCFVAGTRVLTDKGSKDIQDIKVGDLVRTGSGNLRPVVRTMSRAYKGDLYSVKVQGLPERVRMTAEHPVKVLRKRTWEYHRGRQSHGQTDYEQFFMDMEAAVQTSEFVEAQSMACKDFVILPRFQQTGALSDARDENGSFYRIRECRLPESDLLFAYCLGLWLAEGCCVLRKRKKDVRARTTEPIVKGQLVFTLNPDKDKDSIAKVMQFASLCGFRVHTSNTDKHSENYVISSLRLVRRFTQLCGRHAKDKRLHHAIFGMPAAWKMSFLAGYLDGDGCRSTYGKEAGKIVASTASISLAYDIQQLFLSLGMKASVSKGTNKVSNGCFGKQDNVIYCIAAAASQVAHSSLMQYSMRLKSVSFDKPAKVNYAKNLLTESALCARIKDIEVLHCEDFVTVYNLEVEEEHTYCVPFVVHNCDAWNGESFTIEFPHPENPLVKSAKLDGGLSKYHDDTYMKNGAVYQEHKTKRAGVDPSGEVVAARYNPIMKRGELIIAVDSNKWAPRLQKKAQGKDIFLSIGADVPRDLCFPKGTLILTEHGYRPIEDIVPGDIVHTQQGNWKPVVETCCNPASTLTRISSMGFPLPLESTPNHPVYVVKAEQLRSCYGSSMHKGEKLKRRHTLQDAAVCTLCGKAVDLTASYIDAQHVRKNDYLKIKLDEHAEDVTVGTAFAYLCGMYVGDGCALYSVTGHDKMGITKLAGVSISASAAQKDVDILEAVTAAFKLCTGKEANVAKEVNKEAYRVSLSDPLLASRIISLCGEYSKTKRIPQEILNWSREEKLAFLGGYIDADGSMDTSKANMGIRVCSVNRGLVLALTRICWSLGIRATCYLGNTQKYREKGMYTCYGPSYCVHMREWPRDLIAHSMKLKRTPDLNPTMSGGTVLLHAGYAYVRVTDVQTFESDTVAVYNFEVADDNTYNAEGVDVHNCVICGRSAKTASQHCEHFTKHRGQVYDCGKRACVMNDSPSFYDISGVDVPADQIAFVLSKVASGATAKEAALEALTRYTTPRRPMLHTKAAAILDKLSNMEKQLLGMVEGDKQEPAFQDDEKSVKDFILEVENYPSEEIIDSCNRKGILLSPGMLFNVLGKDCTEESDQEMLCDLDDDCCGDCSTMFEEMQEDDDCNSELLDGSFDEHLPADLSLDAILEKFMPELGVSPQALQGKVIRVTIEDRKPKKSEGESKKASFNKQAQDALRRTYARYVISFAERNDDATCCNALRKIAVYGK